MIDLSRSGEILELTEVSSTQDVLASLLVNEYEPPTVVIAQHQVSGRGRFSRKWVSRAGEALTASIAFHRVPNHPNPHLLGMLVAAVTAKVVGSSVRWPNDLYAEGKKLGGVLAEVVPNRQGEAVVIVGLGINLLSNFPPELEHRATSLFDTTGQIFVPRTLLQRILTELSKHECPLTWADVKGVWDPVDATEGKQYVLPDGQIVTGKGLGPNGELLTTDGTLVLAADAWFGV